MEIQVNFDYREEDVSRVDVEGLARFVISSENKPEVTEVSINFVNNDAIKELNNDYRGVDLVTDVLSFECDGADDGEFAMPGVEEVYELGDIVIAPDVAEKQAGEFGTTFEDELSLLITHGLLHLCGYDHMEEEEARVMEGKERDLLSAFYGKHFVR
mgnify:CR=1 FL=1